MTARTDALPLAKTVLGYSDLLSVRAGERIQFAVSGPSGQDYSIDVHRLAGGGSRPDAPVLESDRMAGLGTFPLLQQDVRPGSYGIAELPEQVELPDTVTIVVTVQATLPAAAVVLALLGGADPVEIGMDGNGGAQLRVGRARCAVGAVPTDGRWVTLVATVGPSSMSLAVGRPDTGFAAVSAPNGTALDVRTVVVGATIEHGLHGLHFSGRIERPTVLRGSLAPQDVLALAGEPGTAVTPDTVLGWDFADDIGAWTVPGRGTAAAPLVLRGAPRRAVCGSTWRDGTDWRETPEQFAAIHCTADSLDDCGWTMQSAWTVPGGARSGCYAARVVAVDGAEDWIPFFVRPAIGAPTARVLFVASSATYFAYGNSRFWWEDPIQEIAQDRLVELGPEEQYLVTHPELAPSNYDLHLDGSPVVFSSRHRPNLFMRPGHSRGESYAADLYLIRWLEHLGLDYDVATDEDLHFDGRPLLDGYPVVLSGTHPEYLSIAMFDAMQDWVEQGGRYVYTGGNGYTSCVTWSVERPWLMENRTTGRMRVDDDRARAEAHNQFDGTLGSGMDESGRSAGSLFGVDSVTMGFDRSYPVLRSQDSYVPEFEFAFAGIPDRLFGGRSMSGGGVIGQEWDNARFVAGTPGHHVLASSIDHSLIPAVLGADPVHHGDVVLAFHGDGVVLALSAMAWTGALHIDDYTNDAERFLRNVLTRFLEPLPIDRPEGSR
jgi:N,N-dimethylformamidase